MAKKSANVYSTLGASNHATGERAQYDLYCTHPKAVEELLKLEQFSPQIWEPCDGLGHISDTLIANGYDVRRSDITTRGRDIEQLDFLAYDSEQWQGDIITNPPYSCATDMVRKALSVVADGCKGAYCSLKASIGRIFSRHFLRSAFGYHLHEYLVVIVTEISEEAHKAMPGIFGRKDIKAKRK
jgi:hypothetical protein|uniref:Adenine-specific methyltransferase n=1 Tax=virus sp. ctoYX9 TaxID=2825822 RepID=A0A8S5RPI2_9VIRU|nr:MAG TPA: adenine-specific methyltransferase [virus sp. ctoYX9]